MSVSADLAQEWLAWQCKMVTGIIRGVFYPVTEDAHLGAPLSVWPNKGDASQQLGNLQLQDAAAQVLKNKRELALSRQLYGHDKNRTGDIVACPLFVDERLVAVVAILMSPRADLQLQTILKLQQWSASWMKTLLHQQQAATRNTGLFFLTLATAINEQASTQAAAMAMANQLADQFGCERVSIGFRQDLTLRLQALSHVASFDARTQLVRRIESAMEEAIDQQVALILPRETTSEALITRAHLELAENKYAVCTIPLPGRAGFIGAITLERALDKPFDKETMALCQSQVKFMGPALENKLREERSLLAKAHEAFLGFSAQLMGSAYLKLKITSLTTLVLLTALGFIQGTYEVTAPASIEGEVRQILVAPQNGYVKAVHVLAGDVVKKGQLLAVLDDRNLILEQQKWQSEYNKIEKEYQEALAKRDRTQVGILGAQRDQIAAELNLVVERLAQTQVSAPFEGVVVSGDLSQSLGAPVETGQVLFEVAPLDHYRVVLEVDDHNMAGLRVGNAGHLIIAALPQSKLAVSIKQVIPIAVSQDTRNFFRVEALLTEPSASPLLPGMRGIAKIEIGERSMLWILTHALVERVTLWLWSLGL